MVLGFLGLDCAMKYSLHGQLIKLTNWVKSFSTKEGKIWIYGW